MNIPTACKLPVVGTLTFALFFLSGKLGATYTIQDDLVVEGETVLEDDLEVQGSVAIGPDTSSTNNSLVFGEYSSSSAWASFAGGADAIAGGSRSIAMGDSAFAGGETSAAFGSFTSAMGLATLAGGVGTLASGDYAVALGRQTRGQSYASFAIGRFNVGGTSSGGDTTWNEEDPLFEIGNGTAWNDRSNAMTVYKDGRTEFTGTVRIEPSGDLSMGPFTNGPQ